jgi:hypothetical protein
VFQDCASTYFVLDAGQRIMRCPVGTSNAHVFQNDDVGPPGPTFNVLSGQTLANGLVRFVCVALDHTGPDWSFRFTCSTSGIQTVQPSAKAGVIYVKIPVANARSGVTLYEGRLSTWCLLNDEESSITFRPLNGDEGSPTWTSPVRCSAANRTFSFTDLAGAPVEVRVNDDYEVVEIHR